MMGANRKSLTVLAIAGAALLSACATLPTGPSVLVLPGTGKTFEAFQNDDAVCRNWASRQVGKSPDQIAKENAAMGAVVGTAIGAAAGAAIGAASGQAGAGAAVGAGVGLLGGTVAGADTAMRTADSTQRSYDNAYMQCMYANGNRIPVSRGSFPGLREQPPPRSRSRTPPPKDGEIPPPPAGPPPAAPPDVDTR